MTKKQSASQLAKMLQPYLTGNSGTGNAGGGVTDHGQLSGLGDDDHPQYLNNARGDKRYVKFSEVPIVDSLSDITVEVDNGILVDGDEISLDPDGDPTVGDLTADSVTTAVVQAPAAGTTAIQINDSSSTKLMTFDTTNSYLYHYLKRNYFRASATDSTNYALINLQNGASYFELSDHDHGDDVEGPYLHIGRNTNSTNSGAGFVRMKMKTGSSRYLWLDSSANLRINNATPIGSRDASGTVVGTQTSAAISKVINGNGPAPTDALATVLNAEVVAFRYKSDVAAFGEDEAEEYVGIVTDQAPAFGMDGGKSFNSVSAFGYTVQAIKALEQRIVELEAKLEQVADGH